MHSRVQNVLGPSGGPDRESTVPEKLTFFSSKFVLPHEGHVGSGFGVVAICVISVRRILRLVEIQVNRSLVFSTIGIWPSTGNRTFKSIRALSTFGRDCFSDNKGPTYAFQICDDFRHGMAPCAGFYHGRVAPVGYCVVEQVPAVSINVTHWQLSLSSALDIRIPMGYTLSMRMKQTTIRVPTADLTRLAALAKKEGLNASDLIRRAIREFLKRAK